MRNKLYHLLTLAILFMVGISSGQAQKRYSVDLSTSLGVDEFSDQVFAINNGSLAGGSGDFIRGLEKSSKVTEDNLFQVEPVGTVEDGENSYVTYRMKNVGNGEYVTNDNGTFAYTATQTRAWVFYVMEATIETEDNLNADPAVLTDFRNVTTTTGLLDNTFVLVDAKVTAPTTKKNSATMLCTNGSGAKPSFSNSNYTTNTVQFYAVRELRDYEYLMEALAEIWGTNVPEDMYNPGDQPGEISQALYDELCNSYKDANAMIDQAAGEDQYDAMVAAAKRCEDAIAAAKAGVVQVKAGYYYFRSIRSENSVTYEDGANMRWVEDWTEKEELEPSDAKYIWQIIPNPKMEGSYFIRNYYSKRYCGVAKALYQLIPTTEDPEESFYIYPANKEYFLIQSASLVAKPFASGYDCLHAQVNGHAMVIWQGIEGIGGSGWKFLHVDDSKVEAIEAKVAQLKLNETLQNNVDEAEASYENGIFYDFDGYKSGRLDNNEDGTIKGLVTSLDQLSTNAQEANEGPLEQILDSNIGSKNFFHSSWSADNFDHANNYPYIQANLGKAVKEIAVKMWPRINGSTIMTNNLPGKIHVVATNTPDDENSWVEIGDFQNALKWPTVTVAEDGTETAGSDNTVTYLRIPFGETAYQYVRLEVATRLGSTTDFKTVAVSTGCFNLAEIRIFESAYSAELSLNNAVPAEVKDALLNTIEKAKAEIANESATQATIDELAKAYKDYLDNYPDPQLAKNALNEAKTFLRYAAEGSEYGYVQEGAKAEFQTALETAETHIKDLMTLAEVKASQAEVAAALKAFNSKINVPANGEWCYIVSKTGGAASDAYVISGGNEAKKNAWSKAEETTYRPEALWQFIHNADGTYSLKNAANNQYMLTPRVGGSAGSGMSLQGDTCTFTVQVDKNAETEGCVNFVFAPSVYLNADPAGPMVSWGSAGGKDNSTFQIIAANLDDAFDGEYVFSVNSNAYTFVTLPISVKADDNCYEVIGRNGDKLELKNIEGEIEGGTPFVYCHEDEDVTASTTLVTVESVQSAIADFVYATVAKEVNGLQGTLAPVDSLHVGYGILFEGNTIVDSELGEGVTNNSAYLLPTVPETTETGAKSIKIDGTINAISTPVNVAEQSVVNVYTLSGVKVRSNVKAADAAKGLPAGLYIVGSKKVIVK